jgi:signal peptidase I
VTGVRPTAADRALPVVRAISAIWTAALIALLVGLAVLVLAGWRLDIVTSPSMEPGIAEGSAVLAQPVNPDRVAGLEVGDVITFRDQRVDALVMHRIVEVVEDPISRSFVTQGDANAGTDPRSVPEAAVVAEVRASVPVVGTVLRTLRPPFGVVVLVLVPLLLALATHRLACAAPPAPDPTSTDHPADPTAVPTAEEHHAHV